MFITSESLDADTELQQIPPNVSRYLKATFDPVAKAEGFATLDEISRHINTLLQSAVRPGWTKPITRNLNWGLYALLPKPREFPC